MAKYTKEVILQMAEEEDVEFIRLQFTDMFGMMKNMAITAGQLEKALNNQCVFDGSSFEGFVTIEEADMFLHPDLDTFAILPWRPQQGKVARLICDVYDREGNLYAKSSRTILQKVIFEAKAMGYEFEISPECEFFLFHTDEDGGATSVTHDKGGYLDLGPLDLGENARRDMVLTLEEMGIDVESSFHEVAAGQHELDFCPAAALRTADQLMTAKFAIRTIAKRHGLHATFMPKPKEGVNGSGMHLVLSLKDSQGKNLFADPADPLGLSLTARHFMAGILNHMKEMTLLTNPTVNSYKRLVPGYDAPVYIAWSPSNSKSCLIRIPSPGGEGIELRCPDGAMNPYLALAACLQAGLEGIEKELELPLCAKEPISLADQEELNNCGIDRIPNTLGAAIEAYAGSLFVKNVLGEPIYIIYLEAKEKEWGEFGIQVTDWEIAQYLYQY